MHALPTGAASLFGTTLLGFDAKVELARFYSTLKDVKHTNLQDVSLQDWLGQQVRHPHVRKFILAMARLETYANAPDMLAASLIVPLLNARVSYLDGGWQTLVDGLRQIAQEAGAKIVTHARVVAIEVAEERHVVHLMDGSRYPADAVLLAINPQTASTLVRDGAHEALGRWATQSVPACVACFDVALRRLPEPRHLFALGIDCPLYYSVHSTWANLAPEDSALIHTMKYLRQGEPAETSRHELEALLDMLQPGWRVEVIEHTSCLI